MLHVKHEPRYGPLEKHERGSDVCPSAGHNPRQETASRAHTEADASQEVNLSIVGQGGSARFIACPLIVCCPSGGGVSPTVPLPSPTEGVAV